MTFPTPITLPFYLPARVAQPATTLTASSGLARSRSVMLAMVVLACGLVYGSPAQAEVSDQTASPAAVAQAPAPSGVPIRIAMIEGLSGPFANTGDAAFRNLAWGAERINAQGGVAWSDGSMRPLEVVRFDSKSRPEEALTALRSAVDKGIRIVTQGNSSAVAAALIDAINKHNEREPERRVVFLNYAAVEPALTNESCSFWHFRYDAHAQMRLAALMRPLAEDKALKRVYLIGQDYSFGQSVVREARAQLADKRPDIAVVGAELHPIGRVKDFLPYITKIKASGAQAVITGNWGNDLTLLVKAAREGGFDGTFYTFYGNALGAPTAMGDAGVGKVLAIAEWFPNQGGDASDAFYASFLKRFPDPSQDYMHMRMQWMMQALGNALSAIGPQAADESVDAFALATQLASSRFTLGGHTAYMRAEDHQLQQQLAVAQMQRLGAPGVRFGVEGSGYGFEVVQITTAADAAMASRCDMKRPIR